MKVLLFQRNPFFSLSHCCNHILMSFYFTGESMGKTSEHLLHQWEARTGADVQSPDPVLRGCEVDEVVS